MGGGFGASSFGSEGFGTYSFGSGSFGTTSSTGLGSFPTAGGGFGSSATSGGGFGPKSNSTTFTFPQTGSFGSTFANNQFALGKTSQDEKTLPSDSAFQTLQQSDLPSITFSDPSLQKKPSSDKVKVIGQTLAPGQGLAMPQHEAMDFTQSQQLTFVEGKSPEMLSYETSKPESVELKLSQLNPLGDKEFEAMLQLYPDDKLNLFDKQLKNISNEIQNTMKTQQDVQVEFELSKEGSALELDISPLKQSTKQVEQQQAVEGLPSGEGGQMKESTGFGFAEGNNQLPSSSFTTNFNFGASQQKLESMPSLEDTTQQKLTPTTGFSFGSALQHPIGMISDSGSQSQQQPTTSKLNFGAATLQMSQKVGFGFGNATSNQNQIPSSTGFSFGNVPQQSENKTSFPTIQPAQQLQKSLLPSLTSGSTPPEQTTQPTSGFGFGGSTTQQQYTTGFSFGGTQKLEIKQFASKFTNTQSSQQPQQSSTPSFTFGSVSTQQSSQPTFSFSFGGASQQSSQPTTGFTFGGTSQSEIKQINPSFANAQLPQQQQSSTSSFTLGSNPTQQISQPSIGFSFGEAPKLEIKQPLPNFTNTQSSQQLQQSSTPSFTFGSISTDQAADSGTSKQSPSMKSSTSFKLGEFGKTENLSPSSKTELSQEQKAMPISALSNNSNAALTNSKPQGFTFQTNAVEKLQPSGFGFKPNLPELKPAATPFKSTAVTSQPFGFSFQPPSQALHFPQPMSAADNKQFLSSSKLTKGKAKKLSNAAAAQKLATPSFGTQHQFGGTPFASTNSGFSFGGTSPFTANTISKSSFSGFEAKFQPLSQHPSFGQSIPSTGFSFGQSHPTFGFGSNPSSLQTKSPKPPKKGKKAKKMSEGVSDIGLEKLPKNKSFSNLSSLGSESGPAFKALTSGGGFTFDFTKKVSEKENKEIAEGKETTDLKDSSPKESNKQKKSKKPAKEKMDISSEDSELDIPEELDDEDESDEEEDEDEREDEEEDEDLEGSFESDEGDFFPTIDKADMGGFNAPGGLNINPPEKSPLIPPNDSDFENDVTFSNKQSGLNKLKKATQKYLKEESKGETARKADDSESFEAKEPEIPLFDPYGNVLPFELQTTLEDPFLASPEQFQPFSFPQPTTGFGFDSTSQSWGTTASKKNTSKYPKEALETR